MKSKGCLHAISSSGAHPTLTKTPVESGITYAPPKTYTQLSVLRTGYETRIITTLRFCKLHRIVESGFSFGAKSIGDVHSVWGWSMTFLASMMSIFDSDKLLTFGPARSEIERYGCIAGNFDFTKFVAVVYLQRSIPCTWVWFEHLQKLVSILHMINWYGYQFLPIPGFLVFSHRCKQLLISNHSSNDNERRRFILGFFDWVLIIA